MNSSTKTHKHRNTGTAKHVDDYLLVGSADKNTARAWAQGLVTYIPARAPAKPEMLSS